MPSGLDLPGDGHLDQSLVPAWLTAVGGLTLGGWATGILTTKKGNSFCTNQYISIRGCKSLAYGFLLGDDAFPKQKKVVCLSTSLKTKLFCETSSILNLTASKTH